MAGGAVTAYGINRSPWFNKSFSVSAKTSIPVMAGIFTWSLMYEITMNSAHRFPEKWGLEPDENDAPSSIVKPVVSKALPFHYQVANLLYGNYVSENIL